MQADSLESAQQALRQSAEELKQAIDDYVKTLTDKQATMPQVDCWHFDEEFWNMTTTRGEQI